MRERRCRNHPAVIPASITGKKGSNRLPVTYSPKEKIKEKATDRSN
jgi:hypothetical protein